MKNGSKFVYAVVSGSACKIGVTSSPKSRLSSLNTSSPEVLKMERKQEFPSENIALDIEKKIHDAGMASGKHIKLEWFDVSIIQDYDRIISEALQNEDFEKRPKAYHVEEKKITRNPVPLSREERKEIEAAMSRFGLRNLSDFLRFAALKVARDDS